LSINVARRKRTALYFSIGALMLLVAGLSAISARDPDGITVRTGMILVIVGASMRLPWQALVPTVVAVWLAPNYARNAVEGYALFDTNMLMELPFLLGVAGMSMVARVSLRELEQENVMLGMGRDFAGTDPITGVFEESQLRSSLEIELSRSRRFSRTFALVLVGIDELRQRFDYRDEDVWQASFAATAELLRGTRANVDRVYRFGPAGFALILPESGPKDVNGLVRRLRRVARKTKPAEGEPGGPLTAHYGATFFPTCAATVDNLLRRAEIALRISDNNASRIQLDGAEAPEMPPLETLRQPDFEGDVALASTESTGEEAALTAQGEAVAAAPALHIVGSTEEEQPIAAPLAIEPGEAMIAESAAEAPQPIRADFKEPAAGTAVESELAPVHALEEAIPAPDHNPHPETIEVEQEPPVGVFAYRAPEPAVDVYNNNWQTEAPLSVIRRPHPAPRVERLNGGAKSSRAVVDDAVLSDALKQLDDTLDLIRSLKKRSA